MEEEITQKMKLKKKSVFREYAEALLIAALVAFTIRAFVFEAFKIPSGSMIPTLSIGDHIFVNKYVYGPRIPFTKIRLWEGKKPDRGEVIVFIYPVDESKDFIKRIVGLPGDKIHLDGTSVFINGVPLEKKNVEVTPDPKDDRTLVVSNGSKRTMPSASGWENFEYFEEVTDGHPHIVQYDKLASREPLDFTVPDGHYFVMGDNRDNSADSREWGFVPAANIKGRAMFVWLSLDRDHGGVRWREFGRWVE